MGPAHFGFIRHRFGSAPPSRSPTLRIEFGLASTSSRLISPLAHLPSTPRAKGLRRVQHAPTIIGFNGLLRIVISAFTTWLFDSTNPSFFFSLFISVVNHLGAGSPQAAQCHVSQG